MRTFYIAVKFCHQYDLSPSYIVTELTCYRFDYVTDLVCHRFDLYPTEAWPAACNACDSVGLPYFCLMFGNLVHVGKLHVCAITLIYTPLMDKSNCCLMSVRRRLIIEQTSACSSHSFDGFHTCI